MDTCRLPVVPLTVPVLLTRIVVTPDDEAQAQTLAARTLRQLILLGRSKNSAEWQRFVLQAPPFVVAGLQELMDEWQRLESGRR
jgi:hypothetical protein